jgi:hypothetical protein
MNTIDPEQAIPTPAQRKHWEGLAAQVNGLMKAYTKPFVTPISRVLRDEQDEHGQLVGTGNYIELLSEKHLLTNEHVARALEQHSLAHQFFGCDDVFRATNPFKAFPLPLDVAVTALDSRVWNHRAHQSAVVPENKWVLAHGGVEGELFFFKGFAAEGSSFHFNHLITNATSHACQEVPLPSDDRFHNRFHFALDYRPDLATSIGDNNPGLPDPHGFSGSLVWNTRFVELGCNIQSWSPDDAVVTGLAWGWPSSAACLVATRAEFVRSAILRTLHP